MNIQDWFPLGWTGWISLQSKGLSRVFSNTTIQKHQFLQHSAFFIVQLSHPYMNTWKTITLTRWTFAGEVMFLLFNMPSRFVIAFLTRSKCLLISWQQSPSAVILEPRKNKRLFYCQCFHCFPIYFPWSDGTRCHDLECWALSRLFHSPLSLSSRGSLFFFAFCHKDGVICISEVIDISLSNLDSCLHFIQSSISHDVLCIEVK